MVRYGFSSPLAYILTVGYLVLTIFALFATYYYIAQIDWDYPLNIFDSKQLFFD